jgi:hypothetical protein
VLAEDQQPSCCELNTAVREAYVAKHGYFESAFVLLVCGVKLVTCRPAGELAAAWQQSYVVSIVLTARVSESFKTLLSAGIPQVSCPMWCVDTC